jgi:signal peptidase I
LLVLLLAALVAAGLRVFLVQTFVIPSASMRPLLHAGDRVLVWRPGAVRRGDVIVFDGAGVMEPVAAPPRSTLSGMGRAVAAALGSPIGERDYVKRVIGLPGDRVVCCDQRDRLMVNAQALDEPYLAPGGPGAVPFDIQVPSEHLWVLGDNRENSDDSRAHLGDPGGGAVPMDHVVGRVVSVWWPWGRSTGVGRTTPTRQEDTP